MGCIGLAADSAHQTLISQSIATFLPQHAIIFAIAHYRFSPALDSYFSCTHRFRAFEPLFRFTAFRPAPVAAELVFLFSPLKFALLRGLLGFGDCPAFPAFLFGSAFCEDRLSFTGAALSESPPYNEQSSLMILPFPDLVFPIMEPLPLNSRCRAITSSLILKSNASGAILSTLHWPNFPFLKRVIASIAAPISSTYPPDRNFPVFPAIHVRNSITSLVGSMS